MDYTVHRIAKSRTRLSNFHFHFFPEVELLDHMVIIFLICWRTPILFSIMAAPICIATNYAWMFPFLHILINTCHFITFYNSHSSRYGGNLSSWFLFACLWWLVKLSTFSCFCQPHVYLLWKRKCLFSSILWYWVIWILHIFWIFIPFQIFPTQGSNPGLLHCRQSLYCLSYYICFMRYLICQYFLPFGRLDFCFVDGFHFFVEKLLIWYTLTYLFLLLLHLLLV